MSLGIFYNQTEKRIINDLVSHVSKSKPICEIKILNIYISKEKHYSEKTFVTDIGIGDNISDFIKNIQSYNETIGGEKFDIVNCRFSMRHFMSDVIVLSSFVEFVSSVLNSQGYFIGFLLDMKRINSIFADLTFIENGPYKIEFGNYDYYQSQYNISINNDNITMINPTLLESTCEDNELYHIDDIILESLHENSLNYILLSDIEKQFGFLNYMFLYKKK